MKSSWALSAVVCLLTAECLAGQTVPSSFIDKGVCPFECCQYGEWVSNTDVTLFESPDTSVTVVARLAEGDSVIGEYGEVWSVPTPFVFKTTVNGESGRWYAKGDTVWAVSYQGEGRFKVWKDGTVYSEDLDFSPSGRAGDGRCETCSHGSLLWDMQATWWVRIRTGDGRIGWSNHPERFDGKDGCSEDLETKGSQTPPLPRRLKRECSRGPEDR
jgi:hypothetical protein